jgi:Na+/H+-dicarboxylate symporter
MRIWLKYLIGIALGIVASFILPLSGVQAQSVMDFIVDLVLRFGRYTLLPLLFFSIATSFFKLRDEKMMIRTGLWTFGVIVASSALLVLFGLISAVIVHLPRIPITVEKVSELPSIDIKSFLSRIFPYSGFEALTDGAFLLPCFVFAGFAGAGAASDKVASKQAVSLFDSLSNVCYIVMSFFTELLSVGMIAISCKWMTDFVFAVKTGAYVPLIIMLSVDLLLIAFVIYPLIIHFLCHDSHPYRVLYASICPFLVAFFSGDTNLALPINIRHGNESLGIRRRINSVTFPLFSIFARGGAAFVETVCFIVILRSYSSLGVSIEDAFWIAGISLLLSFVLGALPTGGPFVAITVMCAMYGRGFEAGYLLLKSVSPIICAFAAGIDALTAMCGSYIVGVKTKMINHIDMDKFI